LRRSSQPCGRCSYFFWRGLLGAADDWPQFGESANDRRLYRPPFPAAWKLLWTYDAGESIESSAAIAGGTVYVGSQSKDLLAIDLATGKPALEVRATDSIGESSPAVDEGMVYVGDLAGVLHAVNAANGKGLWTFKTEAEIRSSPVISGDRLLIGSYDGNLYCSRGGAASSSGNSRPAVTCTGRRRFRAASPMSPAAMKSPRNPPGGPAWK